jgi:sulfur-oxidizing protein SoxY
MRSVCVSSSAICEGEGRVGEIVALTQAAQPNVSQNLALTYRHGVVARRRDGNQIHYGVKNALTADLCGTLCTQIAADRVAAGRRDGMKSRAKAWIPDTDRQGDRALKNMAKETNMTADRREFIARSTQLTLLAMAVSAGLIEPPPAEAAEYDKALFETTSIADTVKLIGDGAMAESKDITLTGPDIAENGAVVPISVTTTLPKTSQIVILVEKNPNTLAADFEIPEGTDAAVTTRVKLGQSTDVYALVKADGGLFYARKEVKVTLGGCGG